MDEFLNEELPKLEAQWLDGSFPALIRAFVWCAGNGHRAPPWVMEAVLDELTYSMNNRPRGGTKTGNSAARERYERAHRTRYLLVKQFLEFQEWDLRNGQRTSAVSEIEAARSAQQFLDGKHPAWGTAEAIRKSYKRLKSG